MGANKNSMGANKNSMGANKNSVGANKNSMGANKNSMGANKNSMGANKYFLETFSLAQLNITDGFNFQISRKNCKNLVTFPDRKGPFTVS